MVYIEDVRAAVFRSLHGVRNPGGVVAEVQSLLVVSGHPLLQAVLDIVIAREWCLAAFEVQQ